MKEQEMKEYNIQQRYTSRGVQYGLKMMHICILVILGGSKFLNERK